MAATGDIIKAIEAGNLEQVRKLLSEDPILAARPDSTGISPLMHAVYRRQAGAIDLLRIAGVKPNWFESAALGDTEQLTAMLKSNATVLTSYASDGFTALHLAAYFCQPRAARILLDHGADPEAVAKNTTRVAPLHSAAAAGNAETVQDLLQHGVGVNVRQQKGWTALHSAAQNGSLEIVDMLLQHGADPVLKNDHGVTALDLARKQAHAEIVNRLSKVPG